MMRIVIQTIFLMRFKHLKKRNCICLLIDFIQEASFFADKKVKTFLTV